MAACCFDMVPSCFATGLPNMLLFAGLSRCSLMTAVATVGSSLHARRIAGSCPSDWRASSSALPSTRCPPCERAVNIPHTHTRCIKPVNLPNSVEAAATPPHHPQCTPCSQPVATLNDVVLKKYLSSTPAGASADEDIIGINAASLNLMDQTIYRDRVRDLLKYLGRKRPWLINDPRLAWLAPIW